MFLELCVFPAKANMDVGLDATRTWMAAWHRWRSLIYFETECLEHLASDNGADVHEYS